MSLVSRLSATLRPVGCVVILGWLSSLLTGCTPMTTVYWSKQGSGEVELQRDVEECRGLQRSVGLDDSRIYGCLEAKGWVRDPEIVEDPMVEDPLEE